LDRVVVSADDEEIAEVAKRHGAEAPFLRPPELARDESTSMEAVLHALHWLDDHEGYRPHYLMLLQPTSPFRTSEDIQKAIALAREKSADSVVSVCPVYHHHPDLLMRVSAGGTLEPYDGASDAPVRHQDLRPVYALNGAIYLVRREFLLERKRWVDEGTYAYVMPVERSMDIDTPWDLYLADLIMKDRIRRETC
jgi:N-acylneuraminate cytidylyltransferase/CMP-N,N'-diacetyllegionaminic acid synthase